uniref:Glycoside hydrolase 35 catalytic domain-containing protein n=1 Tax=Acrobeloides nanus TaxID=290746 RepID=A0A914E9K0_9BILA
MLFKFMSRGICMNQLRAIDGPWDGDFTCGTVPGVLATVDFGNTTNANIDFYFKQQNKYSNGGPAVCTEYWVTWFTDWWVKKPVQNVPGVIDNIAHMYSLNASFNIYMTHGGTNFDFMNGPDVTTSYDYGAAIAENGDITPMYTAIRSFIQNLTDWENPPLDVPANNP